MKELEPSELTVEIGKQQGMRLSMLESQMGGGPGAKAELKG